MKYVPNSTIRVLRENRFLPLAPGTYSISFIQHPRKQGDKVSYVFTDNKDTHTIQFDSVQDADLQIARALGAN